LAKTPRTWSGARSPSGLKRVRQATRRREVLAPRRSAAKTYVAKALTAAATADSEITTTALIEALSALDRAAKVGAIHPNAAARRKSRLTVKVNAALGGSSVSTGGRVTKQTGKARAALSKTARAEAAAAREATTTTETAPSKPARSTTKASATKTTAAKSTAKATSTKSTARKTTKS